MEVKKKRSRPAKPVYTINGFGAVTGAGGNITITAGVGGSGGAGGSILLSGGSPGTPEREAPFSDAFWHTLFLYLNGGTQYQPHPGISFTYGTRYTRYEKVGMGLTKNVITKEGVEYLNNIRDTIEEIWIPAGDFRVLLDLIRNPTALRSNILNNDDFADLIYRSWEFLRLIKKNDTGEIGFTNLGQEAFIDVLPDLLEEQFLETAIDEEEYQRQIVSLVPPYEWATLLTTLPSDRAIFWSSIIKKYKGA